MLRDTIMLHRVAAFDAVQITNAQTWCSRSRTSNSHHYSARSRFRRRLKHSDALRRTYDATTTPETTLRRNYIPNRRCCNLRRGSTANSAALGVRARGSQRCYARYPPLLEEEAGQDEEDCADAEDEAQVQASVSPSKKPKRRGWIKMMGKEGKEEEKSMLGKVGEGAKMTFNTVMGVSTLVSLLLAAEALWELRGTPLTLSNAVPTLTKLLPATGIGVFGAAQVVGLVARVARVIVTLPIMISGTWVILQNVPQACVWELQRGAWKPNCVMNP